MLKKFIWRVKFALETRKIFAFPKGAFKGNHLKLGWEISGKVYEQYKNFSPKNAALSEISEWYNL